jgi:predicted ATPase
MRALWPQAKVLDATLKVSIGEIRKALGDSATQSQFIETVGTKGYRFIAPISLRLSGNATGNSFAPVVGRASELERLRTHLELANQGKRQLVFVTGEPGIGKTTLVEIFAKDLATNDAIITARGQCIEQYGAGEAYMPIIDAVERMCQGSNGHSRVALLRRYAPSWLVNLHALVSAKERSELQRQSIGITPERRLRELAAFLEVLAKDQTVILALEDLHWLDPSSLALISFIARRHEPARLMLIGTYRAGEVERTDHPLKKLKAELELHHYCHHIALRGLSPRAVHEYLTARFETPRVSDRLLSIIYSHSEGNPLFMVNITDYLTNRDGIIRRDNSIEPGTAIDELVTPNTIHQLIERQLDNLPAADQELLKAASVAGMNFSTAAVAARLGVSMEQIEIRFDRLVKQEQFLQREGTNRWPDGTVGARYGFAHALYQNVIYESVLASRKARLHQSIGERLEVGYRGGTEEVAAELALHFEHAGDYHRAVQYLHQAAQEAVRRSGYQEAINYATTGLSLLRHLEPSSQKAEWELSLDLLLGVCFSTAKGYAAAEANEAFSKVRAFSGKVGNQSLLCQSLAGLWSFHFVRGELETALELATDLYKLARRGSNPMSLVNGHMAAGIALFYLADFTAAKAHLEKACSHYDLASHRVQMSSMGWDLGIPAFCYRAKTLWMLGYPEKDTEHAQKALAFAEELSSPFHWGLANSLLSTYHTYRGEHNRALHHATATVEVCQEHGFNHWLASGTIFKGWALARQGDLETGIAYLQDGLDRWKRMGAEMGLSTFLALLAEAYLESEQIPKCLASIEEGLAISAKNKECYYDAELYRLRGEAILKVKNRKLRLQNAQEADSYLLRAVAIAHGQKAKSLELRATTSLCRLWQKTGKEKEAKRMLAKAYSWFTEGFDTPDLREARALLDTLQ